MKPFQIVTYIYVLPFNGREFGGVRFFILKCWPLDIIPEILRLTNLDLSNIHICSEKYRMPRPLIIGLFQMLVIINKKIKKLNPTQKLLNYSHVNIVSF